MMEELFTKPQRRHIKDLNIVPILDMLTVIIFFLLMSTSFMEYTKLTLPPSATATVSSAVKSPPLAPKIFMVKDGEDALKIMLMWGGAKPGEQVHRVAGSKPNDVRAKIMKVTAGLTKDFNKKFPQEKTVQMGAGARVSYQDLISMMDGVRDSLPDIVLVSYAEAEARMRGRKAMN
jgi:biopolymer transport protein ExbD